MSPAAAVRPASLPAATRYAVTLAWRADRRGVLLVVSCQLSAAALLVGLLLVARRVLTTMLGGGAEPADPRTVPLLAAAVLFGTAGGVLRNVSAARQRILATKVDRHVTGVVLRAATEVGLAEFESPAFHDKLQRAVVAARAQPAVVVTALTAAVQTLLTLAAVTTVLAVLAWWLLPVVVLAAVPSLRTARDERRAGYGLHHDLAEERRARQYLERVLTGPAEAKEIRALGLGPALRERWSRRYGTELERTAAVYRVHLLRKVIARLAGDLVTVAVIGIMWWQVTAGRIGLPAALAALAALWQLALRLQLVGALLNGIGEAVLFLTDLRVLEAVPDRPATATPAAFEGLTADRLTFGYPGAGRPALREVSITVRPGEIVALVGANGSGKTTLTKVLAGLYRPDSGTLRHGRHEVADAAALRDLTAVVFQDFVRFRLSGTDNIAFGRPDTDADADRVAAAARLVHADGFLDRLPAGYDTVLSAEFRGGADLSGGQWQRLALARACYRDAPLVILDEPTAALDPEAEAALFADLRQLFAGRTVLLVSHRFSAVRDADRIYVMDAGRIVESGTHPSLLAADGTYARLFRLQADPYATTA
ncbi:ABC transporter ATP-binding protein [Dactylosporangium sp. NPDC050688]|uniref:ABC transporter ATP-binding protein n=1 Tax=Dactylosporangium sp. NPDC050688 TaxID=3157217 RepID=UPI0033FA14BB